LTQNRLHEAVEIRIVHSLFPEPVEEVITFYEFAYYYCLVLVEIGVLKLKETWMLILREHPHHLDLLSYLEFVASS
jgi:hypothetical protein